MSGAEAGGADAGRGAASGPAGDASEPLGGLAEEAARLAGAAADWWSRSGWGDGSSPLHAEHLATGSAECLVCPLCRVVATARKASPETVAHLADAAASLGAALTSLSAQARPGARPARHPGVQHVPVVDGDEGP